MKNKKMKWVLITLITSIIMTIATPIYATSENVQVVKKSDNNYLIYVKDNLNIEFEFAFSNNKEIGKGELVFQNSAKDMQGEEANSIAYIDEDLYSTYFSKDTYLWARTSDGKYIIEAEPIDLKSSLTENDIETANTMTKRISVDTKQIYEKPVENVDGVKITKTVGKVVVTETGKNEYQLIKVEETGETAEFAKMINDLAAGKTGENYYEEIKISKAFLDLYKELLPASGDKKWTVPENNEILQPEEAKENDEYLIFLKNEQDGKTKYDVQLLISFEDYKPEVISEKVVSKLPVTADDPTLFIILAILVLAIIVVVIAKILVNKNKKMGE